MITFQVETKGVEDAMLMLDALSDAVEDLSKPLEQAGKYMIRSILMNFAAGGRPKWAPYSPNTNYQGTLLIQSGTMMNSVDYTVSGNELVLQAEDRKAGIHQHGSPKTNLPARPFLMFQPDDIVKIVDLIQKYLQNVTQAKSKGVYVSAGQKVRSYERSWTNLRGGRTRVIGAFRWVPKSKGK